MKETEVVRKNRSKKRARGCSLNSGRLRGALVKKVGQFMGIKKGKGKRGICPQDHGKKKLIRKRERKTKK